MVLPGSLAPGSESHNPALPTSSLPAQTLVPPELAASQCLALPLCLALLQDSPQAAHHPLRHWRPCTSTPPPPQGSISLGFCSRTSGPWMHASSSGCTLG